MITLLALGSCGSGPSAPPPRPPAEGQTAPRCSWEGWRPIAAVLESTDLAHSSQSAAKKKKHNKHQVRCLTQVLAYPAWAPVHRGCSEERGLAHWCGVADSHSCDTESSCACDEDLSSFTTVQEVQKEKSIIMEDFFCEIFNYMSIYPLITHMYIIQ